MKEKFKGANKICIECNLNLPIENFTIEKNRKSPRKQCKKCKAKLQKARRKSNPLVKENDKKTVTAYREKNRDKINHYDFKRKYGITIEDKFNILNKQNNCCAICSIKLEGKEIPYMDHCHETGAIREVLCRQCNVGLGLFKDNIETLKLAIKYIIKHKEMILILKN